MGWPLPLLLAACTVPDSGDGAGDHATLPLWFTWQAEEAPDDITFDVLRLHLDELVLQGTGPGGTVAIGVHSPRSVSVEPGQETAAFVDIHLAPGAYDDLHLTAYLRPDAAGTSLWGQGHKGQQEVELVVTGGIALRGELEDHSFRERTSTRVMVELRPQEWVADLEDLSPTGGRLLIDAQHNVPAYFDVIEAIEDDTDIWLEASDW